MSKNTYNFTANDSILDCRCISTPQQVHFIFDSWQYNLGPDGREVIGIIVHVPMPMDPHGIPKRIE
jgi:hypothetical protein